MNTTHDTCIIGAGWSGLLACKYLKAAGFNPVVLEKGDDIGGVWRYRPDSIGGVLSSTITTSSVTATEMSDFPMPDDFPEFPRHSQIMDYLRAYCDRFDLWPHLRFGAGVARAEKDGDAWVVTAEDGTVYRCRRVVVCSGVHQEPGDSGRERLSGFSGTVLHSAAIKPHLSGLADRRVLLIGTGETASDLSVELARLTPHLTVSSPRGQWFVGRTSNFPVSPPTLNDYYSSPLRRLFDPTDSAFAAVQTIEDRYGACGSGIPEWQTDRPFQGQFFNKNTLIIDLWRLGQVTAKPAVVEATGETVRFADGTGGDFDAIILCTGFQTVFPFLPEPYRTQRIDAHFKMMLADDATLSFVGFVRPIAGSIPTIAELQSRCLAALYAGEIPLPAAREEIIAADQAYSRRRFASDRIAGLVDMAQYLDELAVWLGVEPDHAALFQQRFRDGWDFLVAPYNGAQYWLNDPGRRQASLERMRRPRYIIQHSLHAWAVVLYRNAFPLRRLNVFSERRGFWLRALVGLLLAPLFAPAGLVLTRRNLFTQVYGAALLLLLSPVILSRLVKRWRRMRRLRAMYRSGAEPIRPMVPEQVAAK